VGLPHVKVLVIDRGTPISRRHDEHHTLRDHRFRFDRECVGEREAREDLYSVVLLDPFGCQDVRPAGGSAYAAPYMDGVRGEE
jgi:hypothetical protein